MLYIHYNIEYLLPIKLATILLHLTNIERQKISFTKFFVENLSRTNTVGQRLLQRNVIQCSIIYSVLLIFISFTNTINKIFSRAIEKHLGHICYAIRTY